MTRDEFTQAYAARSGVTVEVLRRAKREARPCGCGEGGCEGWQMAHVSDEDWPEDSPFPKSDPRYTASACSRSQAS
jgi:hypothetical protein